MQIKTISDFRRAIRNGPYAWPGGYPLYFVMSDGAALSFAAAKDKSNRREILHAIAHPEYRASDWRPVAFEINYEDTELYCAHTGEKIESAYGDA